MSSENISTLHALFQGQIEHMETKVKELEEELHFGADDHEKVEIFKEEMCRLSEDEQLLQEKVDSMSQQIKALHDENDELLKNLKSKNDELQNYRQKYLEALERCEEQSCEITALKKQSTQNIEAITTELEYKTGLMSQEIHKKQIEIDETKKSLKIRENTIDALAKDLETCICQSETLTSELKQERIANRNLLSHISNLKNELDEQSLSNQELLHQRKITVKQNVRVQQLEEHLETKQKEYIELKQYLERLKQESARQILRVKEQAEAQIEQMRTQVSDLEQELVNVKALLKSATKERDEARKTLKSEMLKLENKFNEAQLEIRHLRSNIDLIKCSYSNITEIFDEDETIQDIKLHITNAETNLTGSDKKTIQ